MGLPLPPPFQLRDLRSALAIGWRVFWTLPAPSLALGASIALIGLCLVLGVVVLGASPLAWVLAAGFLLIGPVSLAGFFTLYRQLEQGGHPGLADALRGFGEAGTGFWVVAGLCAFLFLVWVTDAGILYAFQVGTGRGAEVSPDARGWSGLTLGVRRFALWAGLLGAALALGLYPVTAFSLPLLYERRAGVVLAIHQSLRAVAGSPIPALAWALVLLLGIVPGALMPPLLALTLPVLAYGSFALYRTLFPLGPESEPRVGQASALGVPRRPPDGSLATATTRDD